MSGIYFVGLDGSAPARRAALYAVEQASHAGAKLVLAHVIEWSGYQFMGPEEVAERNKMRDEEIAGAVQRVITPIVEEIGVVSHDMDTVIRHGHAASTLIELASEVGASHIFLGRRGESKIKALLFGSTAHAVAQVSEVPVTIVP